MKSILLKFIKRLVIITIITSILLSIIIYTLTSTEIGLKFLLIKFLHKTLINKSNNNNIILGSVTGSIFKKITIKNIVYQHLNYKLSISHMEVGLNWLNFIKNKEITIIIRNVYGRLNEQPITVYINCNINLYKEEIILTINQTSFVIIAGNSLQLHTTTNNNSNIKFNLIAKELEMFHQGILGTLLAEGEITNNLKKITAKIVINNLMINNSICPRSLLPNLNNNLTIEIIKTNNNHLLIQALIDFKDLTEITDLLPNISKLKGSLQGKIKLDLNNNIPKISSNLAFKNLSLSLLEYGVKIKPLQISFIANEDSKINIIGNGTMRNGPGKFNLQGYFEPFTKHFNNLLEVTSNELEFINTREYNLIGSMQLKIKFLLKEYALRITGDTAIKEGTINLDQQMSSKITKSHDVVFINNISNNKPIDDYLKIIPDLNLRIEPNTKLIGKGLNTNISGKLRIYSSEDNSNLLGDGRISIKKGTYNLSGQEFNITKGRIIYLPRTFITNPILDIKITPTIDSTSNNINQEKYVYIEGTLENPIIKDNGLINEHQAILQLLNFGNSRITSNIKEKLKLHEFGIQENHDIARQFKQKPTEESFLDNKNFVIGKKITNKLHLQYLKTLNSTNNTIRLKYKLNTKWSLDLESSTEDGHGADLRFAIEK